MAKATKKLDIRAKAAAARKKVKNEGAAEPYMPDAEGRAAGGAVIAVGRPDLSWLERAALLGYVPPDGERTEDFQRKVVVLEGLSAGMTVSMAASRAGIGRTTAMQWRSENNTRYFDPALKAAWEIAMDVGAEFYENEVRRRATEGTLKPVYQQGELVGHVREFSDNLLIMATKARLPHKYRENVHTTGDLTVNVTNRDMRHKVAPKDGGE